MSDFDNLEISSSLLPDNFSYLVRDNFFLQLKKKGDNSQGHKQDMTNLDDLKNELFELTEEPSEKTSSSKENLY